MSDDRDQSGGWEARHARRRHSSAETYEGEDKLKPGGFQLEFITYAYNPRRLLSP